MVMDNSIFTDYSAEDFEQQYGDGSNNPASESQTEITNETRLGLTWGELSNHEFEKVDKILFGLVRGNVGVMFAVTNLGKTTISLNLALTLAAGRTFHPFIKDNGGESRRVLLIDGESTQAELRDDLKIMMRSWTPQERALVEENLFIICDEEINDEPLNLSSPQHLKAIAECARSFKPDLIIVDTMSALFTLRNESDNAEIKRVVMQPLKKLAKDAKSVVWMLHHIGKQNEDGKTTVGAYLGRGGSNIGGLARTVTALKKDTLDAERVIFSVEKSKGFRLEPVILRLDEESRWFVPTNEIVHPAPTNYEVVLSTARSFGRLVKRKEVVDALDGKISDATITRCLSTAVTRGDLISPKTGYYAPSEEYTQAIEEASKIM
ncbi:MAG TPA: AAA family ATPase [Pyrinomonadaceae bacterium]|nr:AAA family ATPase [Pyrinomonadaceae bacterium]